MLEVGALAAADSVAGVERLEPGQLAKLLAQRNGFGAGDGAASDAGLEPHLQLVGADLDVAVAVAVAAIAAGLGGDGRRGASPSWRPKR